MKVLILGAAGRVGRALTTVLSPDHDLVLGDVLALDDPRYIHADVRDPSQLRQAMQGCEAVVHLAIVDWPSLSAQGAGAYETAAFAVHVLGTYNVLWAAVDTGVRRVLYSSSVSAVAGYPKDEMVGSHHRHLGGGVYGITKGFGEELCRMFHHGRGLSVVILRLGNVFCPDLPDRSGPGGHPSRVHVDDVTRAFAQVLASPSPTFALVHVVGDNPGRHWDLEAARTLYGWQPTVSFGPDGLPMEAKA